MPRLSVASDLEKYGPNSGQGRSLSYDEALAYCRRLAQTHYENFTVASWLLPRHLLPHFYAIYAYCRWADDLADEMAGPEQSLQLLDWWHAQLENCYAGASEHPVFVALQRTIEAFSIPREPFASLLIAFRQDQRVNRYETAEDMLGYCRYSANPVGRLILYLGRAHEGPRLGWSDSICTGLQLANFCQDVKRDWRRNRVYLPADTFRRTGYTDAMFAREEYNAAFRAAMQVEVDRAEQSLREGAPLVAQLPKELRLDVALFVEGGLAILREIRKLDYDVWRRRPTVTRRRKLWLLACSWFHARRISAAETAR